MYKPKSSSLRLATVRRKSSKIPLTHEIPSDAVDNDIRMSSGFANAESGKPPGKRFLLGLVVVAILGLAWMKRSWFVAATVNGRPIWRSELNQTLTARFGEQTLEAMVTERLIKDAAAAQKISISAKEVEEKEAEFLSRLGADVNLEELLKFQGMTKIDFDEQTKLQLTVEKILGGQIQITESDINNFIASNRAQLVATQEAQMRAEARQTMFNQQISKLLQPWFGDLRAKAKVIKF